MCDVLRWVQRRRRRRRQVGSCFPTFCYPGPARPGVEGRNTLSPVWSGSLSFRSGFFWPRANREWVCHGTRQHARSYHIAPTVGELAPINIAYGGVEGSGGVLVGIMVCWLLTQCWLVKLEIGKLKMLWVRNGFIVKIFDRIRFGQDSLRILKSFHINFLTGFPPNPE